MKKKRNKDKALQIYFLFFWIALALFWSMLILMLVRINAYNDKRAIWPVLACSSAALWVLSYALIFRYLYLSDKNIINNKLLEDFSFVMEYGFSYDGHDGHYEYSSIKFENVSKSIYLVIGFDYHEYKFSISYCSTIGAWQKSQDLNLNLEGTKRSYKSQLPVVQYQLKEFLKQI